MLPISVHQCYHSPFSKGVAITFITHLKLEINIKEIICEILYEREICQKNQRKMTEGNVKM